MDFPTLISRMNLFPIFGVLGGIFHFFQIFIEHTVSKQWIPWSEQEKCLKFVRAFGKCSKISNSGCLLQKPI